jgi:hypothetical protein
MSTSNNGLSLRWIVASSDRGSARRSLKTSSEADLMSMNGPRPAGEKESHGPSRSCGEVAPATACIVTRTSEDDMVSLCGNNAGKVCRFKGICQESWQRRLGVVYGVCFRLPGCRLGQRYIRRWITCQTEFPSVRHHLLSQRAPDQDPFTRQGPTA